MAAAHASLNASAAAAWNAMSLLSTGWPLPSYTSTRTSTSGKPSGPFADAERTPFSQELWNCVGIVPPTTAQLNSIPDPRSSGRTRSATSAN